MNEHASPPATTEEIRRTYHQGAQIFAEGERGAHAFIIERGRVEITFERQGRKVRVAVLGPGEIFGEMALIDDRERSATATALVPTETVLVNRDQIQTAMRGADPTMKLLLEVLLGRFRAMQGRMDWLSDDEFDLLDGPSPETVAALASAQSDAHQKAIERLKFQQELKRAVEDDDFRLLLQPVVSLADGRIHGFEALIRWDHAVHGQVPPTQFIRIAEGTDLIKQIDRLMVHKVLNLLAQFRNELTEEIYIAVNLSGHSFSDQQVIDDVKAALEKSALPSSMLRVEITEGVLIDNPKAVAVILDDLRAIGVQIAIDDFGTGYSSLGYLVGFPINTLKIDRVFVHNMLTSDSSLEIVRAIIGMAHALNLTVIAEGVETVEELQALWRMECEHAQGYLMSRPVSPDQAIELAKRGPALALGPVVLTYP